MGSCCYEQYCRLFMFEGRPKGTGDDCDYFLLVTFEVSPGLCDLMVIIAMSLLHTYIYTYININSDIFDLAQGSVTKMNN